MFFSYFSLDITPLDLYIYVIDFQKDYSKVYWGILEKMSEKFRKLW